MDSSVSAHPTPLRRVCVSALVSVVVLVLSAVPALAQDDETGGLLSLPRADQKRFERLVNDCIKANNRDRFEEAEALCLEAAEITPHPTTWYVRARIYDRTNRCDEAAALYRQVLETPPAGAAEARFVDEIGDDARDHLAALGDCSARFELVCEGDDLVVVTGEGDARRVLTGCPIRFDGVAGPQTVTVLAPGSAPSPLTLDGLGGKDVSIELERPPAASTRGTPMRVTCTTLTAPAALTVDGELAGLCGDTIHLPPGNHRIEALATDGAVGLAVVDVGAEPGEVDVARLRPVSFVCDDPAVRVRVDDPRTPIDDPCGALSSASVMLPVGAHATLLSDDEGRELDLTIDVPTDRDPDPVRIQSLADVPVSFEITCADDTPPTTYVRIGERVGTCPMRGTLPLGTYAVEARRDGYDRWTSEVVLTHRQPRVEVPLLESSSFWTAGSITTLAGGAILLSAVAVDIAGQGDLGELDDFQAALDAAAENNSPEDFDEACIEYAGSTDGCDTYHDDLKSTVNTNILVTRVLYGVGLAVVGTGAGLWIYEALSSDVDELADRVDSGASLEAPLVLPTLLPEGGGVSLRWTW